VSFHPATAVKSVAGDFVVVDEVRVDTHLVSIDKGGIARLTTVTGWSVAGYRPVTTLRLRHGEPVALTSDHLVMVHADGVVQSLPAKYLQPGDRLPTVEGFGRDLLHWNEVLDVTQSMQDVPGFIELYVTLPLLVLRNALIPGFVPDRSPLAIERQGDQGTS